MKNFYFDICAIPILLLIIYVYYSRRITRYREYRVFFLVTSASLICAVLDIVMEFVVNPLPLTATEVVLGNAISLDDYGMGYSNIQRVRELPLSFIKVDKSMVDDMFTADGSVIMQNTVRMMQGIDKQLVIEGVETREALSILESMSCDYIQGYYFSKPLPEDEFVAFMQAQAK